MTMELAWNKQRFLRILCVAKGAEFQLELLNNFSNHKKHAAVHYYHLLWCEFNTLPRGTDGSGLCLCVSQADGGAVGFQHRVDL